MNPCGDLHPVQGALVAVVDDDESVRESLPALLQEWGLIAHGYPSAEAFLASGRVNQTQCLILDVAMPGMSGPDLQRELLRRRLGIPVVFITAQRDSRLRPRLLAGGAVECLSKPFNEAALLEAICTALGRKSA
jgi:FixJ family two-component response regulator